MRSDVNWLDEIELAPMMLDDLDDVLRLERHSFPSAWSRQSYERELANENSYYICARLKEGLLVGYVGLWIILDEAHVTTLAVNPRYRRRGLGSKLMHLTLNLARRRGATKLSLEVRAGNQAALMLYLKLGFEITGRLRGYYGDTGEDGIVMERSLLE